MRIEVEINGRMHDVTVERDRVRPERVQVSWDGTTREVDARIVERDRHGMVLSLIEVGSAAASRQVRCVASGRDGLTELHLGDVVVEAMKMENELTSPRAGVVSEVPVTEGMSVEAGRLLAALE